MYRTVSANLYTYNKQAAAALDSIAAKQGDDGRWVTVLTEAHRFGKGEGSGMIGRRLGGTEYGLPWDGRRENRGRSEVKVVVGPGVKVKSNDVFQLSERVTGSKAADKFWHDRWAVEVVTEDGWVFIGYHGNAVVVSKVTGKPLDNPGARQSAKGMGVLEARVRKHVQAGRRVVVAGDGNVSQRSKWHAAPGVALTEAGLSDQRFHRVDFTATNAQIRQHNTFNVPGADHEGMWADIRNTQGGDDVDNIPDPLERITFRGKTMDRKTAAALAVAERRLGYELTVTQGAYNAGGVGASAGTHDRGGVIDLAKFDADNKVKVLRDLGFAAWRRLPSQGPWPEHIHAVMVGHQDLAPAAAEQVIDYKAGLNGLATKAPDSNTYRPDVEPFNFAKAWRDDLLRQRISGIQARRKKLLDQISGLRQKITYKGGKKK